MIQLGLEAEDNSVFWITGELSDGKQTDKESLAVLTWAWRALYASRTRTHLEGTTFDPKVALFTTFQYVISRTIAHGTKWRYWFRQ
jgi:hypothetical protein